MAKASNGGPKRGGARGGSTAGLKLTQLGKIAPPEPREWYFSKTCLILRQQAASWHLDGLYPKVGAISARRDLQTVV